MQIDAFTEYTDLSDSKILLGLSGGINSMGILCFLAAHYPKEYHPKELHLFYADFTEHSPGTLAFVRDGMKYAEERFPKVFKTITYQSVIKFFRDQKMIPHPTVSPCSRMLKIEPMFKYYQENDLDFDLIGYVRHEKSRINTQAKSDQKMVDKGKPVANHLYPIVTMTDQECLDLCEQEIGWVPAIYKLERDGKRIFSHNNCLPCKNMHDYQMKDVKDYFPEYYAPAEDLMRELNAHWGRKDEIDELMCPHCDWD